MKDHMKFKTRYGITDSFDWNSLYPQVIKPMLFPNFELVETQEDLDTSLWYKVRVYTTTLDKWIISQAEDKWDHAASDNYRGDSTVYWIHGTLYTFMILKWEQT